MSKNLNFAFFPLSDILLQMKTLASLLPYIQIGLAALLITVVLLQKTGAGVGGAFGGDGFSSGFHTRRGIEKTLFRATIIIGLLFVASALLAFLG